MTSSRGHGKLIFEFGPFRLDAAEHLLLRGNRPVSITDKAFALLVVLVQNAGRLMTKGDLMDKVWGDVIVEESTLAQNIKTLRNILGDNARSPRYIKTVKGHGYRFIHPVKEVRRALAVLPFQPMLGDPKGDMLGLGLAAAVITKLDSLGISDLVVRPRSAIIRYDVPNQDPFAAAHEQDADYVVVGMYQRSEEQIRVDVDFLRVYDESKIWAREFPEKITDSISVQQALADSIAHEVALYFGHSAPAEEEKRVRGDYTISSDAYQLYVEGRFHWSKFTTTGFKLAFSCFKRAIKIDPDYAKAYSGLSECWTWLGIYALLPPDRAFPKARVWAERALQIYPDLSGAHTTLAFIEMFVKRDKLAAIERFERAITLYRNNFKAHLGYSLLLVGLKNFKRALEEIDNALEIYSVSLINNAVKAMILYQEQRYHDALAQLAKTSKLDENFDAVFHLRALALIELKDYDQAVAAAHTAIEKAPNNLLHHMVLAHILARKGSPQKARKIIKKLEAMDEENWYVSPFHLATVYAALGDQKRAYYWLEQARDKHDTWYIFIRTDPRLASLRDDPQFEKKFPGL